MANSVIKYKNDFTIKRQLTSNDDLNNFIGFQYNGIYWCDDNPNTPNNLPLDGSGVKFPFGILIVTNSSPTLSITLTHQYYIRLLGQTDDRIFMRVRVNGAWQNWTQISRERSGSNQSFKIFSTLDQLIRYATGCPFYPIINGTSAGLTKSLTGVSSSGIVIAKNVVDGSVSRIDYMVIAGGTGLIGKVFQGSIDVNTSTTSYYQVSSSIYGSLSMTLYCYGWITGSGKNLVIYAPLDFKGSTVNVTSLQVAMRKPTGSYVLSNNFDGLSYINRQSLISHQKLLMLELIKSDGWGETNNIPLTGAIILTCTIS